MRPAILALNDTGLELARRIASAIGGDVHGRAPLAGADIPFEETVAHCRRLFAEGRPVVGICAGGILIRAVAPLLADKQAEPPVIAVSEDGASVVPLVGGHHGANELARTIAGTLGAHAAVTTAGDLRFGVALDAPPAGWTLANPEDAKPVMAALLNGGQARLEGEADWLAGSDLPVSDDADITLAATIHDEASSARRLVYHPRRLAVGIGCERGTDTAEVKSLVQETLSDAGLSPKAVACIVSIDLKADETAILAAAENLGVPARFFTVGRLERETPRLANPSDTVFAEVGCHGVAEGAALAAAGPHAHLIVAKRKSRRATCAVAEAPAIIDPATIGRARGSLAIVGIGPGTADWLTPHAARALERADTIVGYGLYLDLVGGRIAGKDHVRAPLGAEEERVRRALDLAATGRDVALISSGDAGIYAMATLVFECLESGELEPGAERIAIDIAPGISAMQAAAARAGAPLGHDFCTISLSDLLTPWEAIERRIRAAADGDFVIAFYNPVSQRRRTQLAAARDILLQHRPAETPVILGRNLGRDGEQVTTVTLEDLDVDDVDMLTLVVVGASSTRQVTAAGRTWTYTPRGYEKKRAGS
jgi:cobalt-precorrin 5A hydrolase/precorrin-3B C17-methyltransferase